MPKKIIFIVILIVIIVGIFFLTQKSQNNKKFAFDHKIDTSIISPPGNRNVETKLVSMRSTGFEPQELTVKKNTTVIFRNDEVQDRWPAADDHPEHDSYLGFDPQEPVKSSEVWSFNFDKVGVWGYHDHLFPEFIGKIIVVENLKDPDTYSF